MKPGYVDVFISHKSEDKKKALALKQRIEKDYKLTCWIDAEDEEMQRIQEARPVNYKLLTDRIREHLRTCRCLIFAYSTESYKSRWMPWELGFFDGRSGRRLIGLYDLDEGAGGNPAQPVQSDEIGIPEFLPIYRELTSATLEGFLQYVRSPRALSDRADVDIDRWSNLVAGIMRDPVNVSIDALQFWIAYHQVFWDRVLGISGSGLSRPLLAYTEVMRGAVGPLGKMMRSASPGMLDGLIQEQAKASDAAQGGSYVQRPPDLGNLAQAFGDLQLDAVDRLVKLLHDAGGDAHQANQSKPIGAWG